MFSFPFAVVPCFFSKPSTCFAASALLASLAATSARLSLPFESAALSHVTSRCSAPTRPITPRRHIPGDVLIPPRSNGSICGVERSKAVVRFSSASASARGFTSSLASDTAEPSTNPVAEFIAASAWAAASTASFTASSDVYMCHLRRVVTRVRSIALSSTATSAVCTCVASVAGCPAASARRVTDSAWHAEEELKVGGSSGKVCSCSRCFSPPLSTNTRVHSSVGSMESISRAVLATASVRNEGLTAGVGARTRAGVGVGAGAETGAASEAGAAGASGIEVSAGDGITPNTAGEISPGKATAALNSCIGPPSSPAGACTTAIAAAPVTIATSAAGATGPTPSVSMGESSPSAAAGWSLAVAVPAAATSAAASSVTPAPAAAIALNGSDGCMTGPGSPPPSSTMRLRMSIARRTPAGCKLGTCRSSSSRLPPMTEDVSPASARL
mmetsp:Transcript_13899/g.33560  ORF Transcript_13899/g.33560 Transcript_13899/m.33560 type:complete len:444 (-) Transcript_13899:597-1928(-)